MQRVPGSVWLQIATFVATGGNLFRPFAGRFAKRGPLGVSRETKKPAHRAGLSEAADGTRTHDLLHGKQWRNPRSPLATRDRGVGDARGLPAITPGLGNEWVAESRRSAADGQRVQRSLNPAKHARAAREPGCPTSSYPSVLRAWIDAPPLRDRGARMCARETTWSTPGHGVDS
jgi:hypothetical protein